MEPGELLIEHLQLDSTIGRLNLKKATIPFVQVQFRNSLERSSFREDQELTGPQSTDDSSLENLSRPEAYLSLRASPLNQGM